MVNLKIRRVGVNFLFVELILGLCFGLELQLYKTQDLQFVHGLSKLNKYRPNIYIYIYIYCCHLLQNITIPLEFNKVNYLPGKSKGVGYL